MALSGNAGRAIDYIDGLIQQNEAKVLAGPTAGADYETVCSDYRAGCKVIAELKRIRREISEIFKEEDDD